MKYIIIDDEPLARKGIRLLADQVPDLEHVAEYANPILAHNAISSVPDLDLLFLDIEMPGINGLQYLRELRPNLSVILTTAYDQYAVEAFELEVIDYLLKPVKLSRFIKAVERAREFCALQLSENKVTDGTIYIKSDRMYIRLHLDDILYIKGLKDYVVIHTKDKKYMTALNMSTIYGHLPEDIFARVSKSYIINTAYISAIDVDTILLAGHEVPLGNTYKESFIEKYVKGSLLKR